jgi:hypothetical protein
MLPGEVGLFASNQIPAGTVLISGDAFSESWVSWEDMKFASAPSACRNMIEKWCYFDDHGAWIPPDFNSLPVYYHINHSCQPNVGHDADDGWVALCDIIGGEELFMDFRLTSLASRFAMQCSCGTRDCAGVVRGDAWMDRSFAKKNLDRFPPYFRDKVIAYHGLI